MHVISWLNLFMDARLCAESASSADCLSNSSLNSPISSLSDDHRCNLGGKGWPVFPDTSRAAPTVSRARHILNIFQMLSPSREVLLLKGAKLGGRETTTREETATFSQIFTPESIPRSALTAPQLQPAN